MVQFVINHYLLELRAIDAWRKYQAKKKGKEDTDVKKRTIDGAAEDRLAHILKNEFKRITYTGMDTNHHLLIHI